MIPTSPVVSSRAARVARLKPASGGIYRPGEPGAGRAAEDATGTGGGSDEPQRPDDERRPTASPAGGRAASRRRRTRRPSSPRTRPCGEERRARRAARCREAAAGAGRAVPGRRRHGGRRRGARAGGPVSACYADARYRWRPAGDPACSPCRHGSTRLRSGPEQPQERGTSSERERHGVTLGSLSRAGARDGDDGGRVVDPRAGRSRRDRVDKLRGEHERSLAGARQICSARWGACPQSAAAGLRRTSSASTRGCCTSPAARTRSLEALLLGRGDRRGALRSRGRAWRCPPRAAAVVKRHLVEEMRHVERVAGERRTMPVEIAGGGVGWTTCSSTTATPTTSTRAGCRRVMDPGERSVRFLDDVAGPLDTSGISILTWDGRSWGIPSLGPPSPCRTPARSGRCSGRPTTCPSAEAYVLGDYDIHGDIEHAFTLADRLGETERLSRVQQAELAARRRASAPARTATGLAGGGARAPSLTTPGPGGDPLPLRRRERLLLPVPGRSHELLVRVLRPSGHGDAGRGPAPQDGPHLPEAHAEAGDEAARHRMRLGRAGRQGGARLRRLGSA